MLSQAAFSSIFVLVCVFSLCFVFVFVFHFLYLNSFSGMSYSDLSLAHFVNICRTSTDLLGTLRKHDGKMFYEKNKSSKRALKAS